MEVRTLTTAEPKPEGMSVGFIVVQLVVGSVCCLSNFGGGACGAGEDRQTAHSSGHTKAVQALARRLGVAAVCPCRSGSGEQLLLR